MTPEMTQEMTPVMTSEMIVSEEVVVDLSLLVYNPMIECPVDVQAHMKVVYIFTQWYSQIPENVSGLVSMTDASLLGHFDVYYTYINSKKCKAIRKTKGMFPPVIYGKKPVLDSEGNVVVAEKKKRVKKVNVEVDGEVDGETVPVVEKKKRVKKVNVEVGSDGETVPVVAEKKKRVKKVVEVNVEVGSDGETVPVVAEKKKRVKKVVENVVVEENENVVVEVVEPKKKKTTKKVAVVADVDVAVVEPKKKKTTKKTKAVVAEDSDEEITAEDMANALQYLADMEERMQEMELEEED